MDIPARAIRHVRRNYGIDRDLTVTVHPSAFRAIAGYATVETTSYPIFRITLTVPNHGAIVAA